MNTVVRSETAPALPLKWQLPLPTEIGAGADGLPDFARHANWRPGGRQRRPELYRYLVAELDKLKLAYLHFIHDGDEALAKDIRKSWSSSLLLLRTKRSREALGDDVEVGLADVVPIGKWALANPDFVERFRNGAELNAPDFTTLFGGGAKGYIDYPALA